MVQKMHQVVCEEAATFAEGNELESKVGSWWADAKFPRSLNVQLASSEKRLGRCMRRGVSAPAASTRSPKSSALLPMRSGRCSRSSSPSSACVSTFAERLRLGWRSACGNVPSCPTLRGLSVSARCLFAWSIETDMATAASLSLAHGERSAAVHGEEEREEALLRGRALLLVRIGLLRPSRPKLRCERLLEWVWGRE